MKRKNLDDSAFEFMLKEAVSQYADELNTEDIISDITDEEIDAKSVQKRRIYKNVMWEAKKDSPNTHKRMFSLRKCAVLLVATFAMIAILAFSVSAFRILLFKTYIDIQDQFLNVSTKSTAIADESYNNISGIPKDELIIPEWMPKNAVIDKTSDEDGFLVIQFSIGEQYMTLQEEKILSEQIDNNLIIENNQYDVKDIKILGFDGRLINVASEKELTCYTVVWNSDTMRYQLSTDVSGMMLNAILSSLKFHTE